MQVSRLLLLTGIRRSISTVPQTLASGPISGSFDLVWCSSVLRSPWACRGPVLNRWHVLCYVVMRGNRLIGPLVSNL